MSDLNTAHLRNVMQLATFRTGANDVYAMNIAKVKHFIMVDDIDIKRMPDNYNGIIQGIVAFRDEFITILNIDKWIGNDIEFKEAEYKVIIYSEFLNKNIGFLAKDILAIVEKSSSELQVSDGEDSKVSYYTEVPYEGKNTTCIVFNAEKLIKDIGLVSDHVDLTDVIDEKTYKEEKPLQDDIYVLIAEDSPVSIQMLNEFFKTLDIKYEIHENGQLLLDRLFDMDAETVGLIITDLEMPVTDGFSLINQIKTNLKYKNIPILVNSSMSNQGVVEKILNLGAVGMVPKVNFKLIYEQLIKFIGNDKYKEVEDEDKK